MRCAISVPFATYLPLFREYLLPQRRTVGLMTALLLLSIVMQLLVPIVARQFINSAQSAASNQQLIQIALLFIGITALHQLLRVTATYTSEKVSWRATNALRRRLTAHLLTLDYDFYQHHSPGELIERVDGDVNLLAGFFSAVVIQLAGNFLLLLGIVVTLAWVDWRLGLAFMALSVVGIFLLTWVRRFGTPHWQAARGQSATFYGLLGEELTATEDLRSSGAVPYALHRFMAQMRLWLPVERRANLWATSIWMMAMVIFGVSDLLAYGISGSLFMNGLLTLGTVYMIVAYAAMIAAPIETIRTQLQDLQRADAAILRVQELLALKPRLQDGDLPIPTGPLSVEFAGVHFAYAGETADEPTLHEISFRLEAGHVLGILGRTGSGKSTLARLLFRWVDPQQGTISINGIDLRHARLSTVRRRIAYVTQEVQLFEATLRENLTSFQPSFEPGHSDAQLVELLESLGLQPMLARLSNGLESVISSSTISAGEAQLVALGRVFLKDPGVVILDEASSRLDPATEELLERALNRLLQGRTALIIAHRLATLDRATDLLLLEKGRVVEAGPRRELATNPQSHYARLRRLAAGAATETNPEINTEINTETNTELLLKLATSGSESTTYA